jgi:putative ABC transport system ATP-binding protein
VSESNAPAAVVQAIAVTKQYQRGRIHVDSRRSEARRAKERVRIVPALNGIDLTVDKGEIVGIVGPSGSGKTTLLNMIGGLDRPSHGKVLVDNVDLSTFNDDQLADYRLRKIGFIFQFYNLMPTLTALENVELPMNLAGAPKQEQEDNAIELLKTVGLESRIDHMPVEMSGGEQQRVAVARALANKPSVILGDEPTGDLDSKSAEALMDLIVSLRKDRKMTFILVTHDPLVVVECDRVYSVRDGKILRMQTKAENRKIIGDERSMLSKLY